MKAEVISVKQDQIVEAAIKRFSHFGINKTTLSEIALDLRISKPSLFYYFNDKNSLMEAVCRKVIGELLEGFELVLSTADSVEEGLLKFIEIKRNHFKKYVLLAIQGDNIDINKVSPQLLDQIAEGHKKTESLIADLLKKGVDQQSLREIDVAKTSHLLMETMQAFEQGIKCRKSMLESIDIDILFDKQKEVIQLLINGVKNFHAKGANGTVSLSGHGKN